MAKKRERQRRYRAANVEADNARAAAWRKANPERSAALLKAYAKAHPEVNKAATAKYRAKKRLDPEWRAMMAAKAAARRAANPQHVRSITRKSANAAFKRRYRKDAKFTLTFKLRSKLYKRLAARSAKKLASTFELIGCSIDELKVHLQKQFKPGMAWNNYGAWHIDHVKPISKFNLLDVRQQRQAFHFSNLQPLWAVENLAKGAKQTL